MNNTYKCKEVFEDDTTEIISIFKDNNPFDLSRVSGKIIDILDATLNTFTGAWVDYVPDHNYFGVELRYTDNSGTKYWLVATLCSMATEEDNKRIKQIINLINSL